MNSKERVGGILNLIELENILHKLGKGHIINGSLSDT